MASGALHTARRHYIRDRHNDERIRPWSTARRRVSHWPVATAHPDVAITTDTLGVWITRSKDMSHLLGIVSIF
jgi:hypothetical protein